MPLPSASTLCDDRDVILLRKFLTFAACLVVSGVCFGQARPGTPSAKSRSAQKRYCEQNSGFCFSYQATWLMLGDYGAGVIVAPHQTLDRELWDEVTVTTVIPPPAKEQPPLSIDDVIQTAMMNMRADDHAPTTLQRQERSVAGFPAQMIRIRYHDDPSGRDWIEQLVFIEGPDQQIYSVALKAQPGTFSRLEPAFNSIVRSWKLESGGNGETSQSRADSSSKPAPSAPH
jgi:hypothetical protein